MIVFVVLFAALALVWVVAAPADEVWWGVGALVAMGGILAAVKWIGDNGPMGPEGR